MARPLGRSVLGDESRGGSFDSGRPWRWARPSDCDGRWSHKKRLVAAGAEGSAGAGTPTGTQAHRTNNSFNV